jgi:hypothetical protein
VSPDRRTSRGPNPKDEACFSGKALPVLRRAVDDLSWLLSRGYSMKAALKLVGDRHLLRDRQRKALQRCAASDSDCASRTRRLMAPNAIEGETLLVDGYNVLLTVEAALSGGLLLLGRDGALRDLAAMSKHYRRVDVTRKAVELIYRYIDTTGCARVLWCLDRPVSNSGRLKNLIEQVVVAADASWLIELTSQTDKLLRQSPNIVATADSAILDTCGTWFNLAREVVSSSVRDAWILDLSTRSTLVPDRDRPCLP